MEVSITTWQTYQKKNKLNLSYDYDEFNHIKRKSITYTMLKNGFKYETIYDANNCGTLYEDITKPLEIVKYEMDHKIATTIVYYTYKIKRYYEDDKHILVFYK